MGATGRTDRLVSDSYRLADAPPEDFDAAIDEARDEGNLSRANVVRSRDPGLVYRRPETPVLPGAAGRPATE